MAKKISQLTQATEVKSDDVTVIVQDGETKKLPLNMMVTKQDIENKKVAGLAKLDEIEATYENDTYTPTITVKNKSSVKVGEGDGVDYSANVMDGHAKSAILKGKTLVNLGVNTNGKLLTPTDINYDVTCSYLEVGKTYYVIVKTNSTSETGVRCGFINDAGTSWDDRNNYVEYSNNKLVAKKHTLVKTKDSKFRIQLKGPNNSTPSEVNNLIEYVLILEYQQGMENWDIPYFTGMQSVKMPVLTTTGKNLFDVNKFYKDWLTEIENGEYSLPLSNTTQIQNVNIMGFLDNSRDYILTISAKTSDTSKPLIIRIDDKYSNFGSLEYTTKTLSIPKGTKILRMVCGSSGASDWFIKHTQIEVGSAPTSYEPYKSNILTVNEDVVLRGVGEVQDELDLMTGEVSKRIGKRILDGSEAWYLDEGTGSEQIAVFYSYNTLNDGKVGDIITDKFAQNTSTYVGITTEAVKFVNNKTFYIAIDKSKLASVDITGFKAWLQSNPVTVQYQLDTESIKTVDLMPSGTHPSTTPYCWKNGHIQLSSSGLLPNLEYSVVTSRAGQINQNATMIVKNDKRIFDLEILLAGGLVNTTYQALTLQNQVETGLSKVSLSSETEPDYLLYHMIMKLIEEKAYKLDDLTEKVSVFYLYEKLSDEQFETIYSALYPFVEDEIVEEPVVEELPEVVEDEVIM
nr:MAG TPA: hypothetical protein [Caudoviricetes sp.]